MTGIEQSSVHGTTPIRPGNTPQRVLLTLGRLPKALELARSLHAAGCKVFIADPFRNHLCKPSRAVARSFQVPAPNNNPEAYYRALLDIIAQEQIELVIPVSEEALHAAQIRPGLPDGVRMFGPDHETLVRLHDKENFIQLAESAGLPVPLTARADTRQAREIAAFLDHVVKPIHGCSGLGLHLRKCADPLPDDLRRQDLLVQERLEGQHVSSFSLARDGEVQLTTLYTGTVMSGTVASGFERVDGAPDIESWIQKFVAAEKYNGFISFDFILDADGTPRAIECNPRLTSGVHFADPATLADLVLTGQTSRTSLLKTARRYQVAHTTLLEAYGAILRPREMIRRFGHVFSARDVLFRLTDPLPFLLMTPMSWAVLKQVLFEGRSFGEASTRDIVWEPPGESTGHETGDVRAYAV